MQNLNLNKTKIKKLIYLLYALVVSVFAYYQTTHAPVHNKGDTASTVLGSSVGYVVSRVVDGDTIHIKDAKGREDIVRLLAVNTLEMKSSDHRDLCLAKLQTQFTKDNLLGKDVYITTDPTQPERDVYNRILAYVATSASSTYFFNDYLMQTGNAKVYRATPPAKNYEKYLQYQNEAIKKGIGMWNNSLCN